jgi:hypothetical protein
VPSWWPRSPKALLHNFFGYLCPLSGHKCQGHCYNSSRVPSGRLGGRQLLTLLHRWRPRFRRCCGRLARPLGGQRGASFLYPSTDNSAPTAVGPFQPPSVQPRNRYLLTYLCRRHSIPALSSRNSMRAATEAFPFSCCRSSQWVVQRPGNTSERQRGSSPL